MPASEAEFLVESNEDHTTRRRKQIIIGGAAVIVAISVIVILVMIFAVEPSRSSKKLNVIMLISDGWGPAAATLTRAFSKKALNIDPYLVGTVRTASSDSLVTDSAAGATAYACGVHTYNGGIGVDANGKGVGTIIEAASRKGMRTGVVTTTRITDATPGSYLAHTVSRKQEDYIALQSLDVVGPAKHVDVMLGGGGDHYYASTRLDGYDLVGHAKANGYTVVQNAEELSGVKSGKVLGLFAGANMAYSIDRINNATINATQPSLPVMAQKALDLLTNDNGFFVMLEGALIDVAEHINDAAAAVYEVLGFDATFQVALDYAKKHGNTVIISTSDHETGGLTLGLQLNYSIGAEIPYAYYPDVLAKFNASCDAMAARIIAGENVTSVVASSSNITDLTEAEIQTILSFVPEPIYVSDALGRILSTRSLIGWTTHGHSGVDVNLYVYGLPDSYNKYTGNHENIDIATLIAELLGLDLASITKELLSFPTNNVTAAASARATRDMHDHHDRHDFPKHL